MSTESPFPREFCKWFFIAGVYESAAAASFAQGRILSRKEFMGMGVLCQCDPQDLAEAMLEGKKIDMLQMRVPNARDMMPKQLRSGIIPGRY
jgi:hypothetical protein